MMKRKDYERPTIKIVKLQQRAHLLYASMQGMRGGYGTASTLDGTDQEWD